MSFIKGIIATIGNLRHSLKVLKRTPFKAIAKFADKISDKWPYHLLFNWNFRKFWVKLMVGTHGPSQVRAADK